MQYWNEYELDKADIEERRNRVKELSLSYTPEWNFDRNNPDIGSVIALLFTGQMEENRRFYNLILHRYHIELANMMGVSLKAAKPSQTVVIMENSQVMQGGTAVRKGTKLLGTDEEGNDVIFETKKDVYISNINLTDLLEISGVHKKSVLLWEEGKTFPIPLFSFLGESSDREELIIGHKLIQDSKNKEIRLYFEGRLASDALAELFCDKEKYRFLLRKNEEEIPFKSITVDGNCVLLKKETEEITGTIVLQRIENKTENIEINEVRILGDADTMKPSFLYDGKTDLEAENFYPFGHEIAAYAELFIGQEEVFTQKGARITISFELIFESKKVLAVPEETDLSLIKKRPKQAYLQNWANCSIQEVAMEYFNGTGWKKIFCEQEYKEVFAAEGNRGIQKFSFEAPMDWEDIAVGGYEGPCIRMSIVRADGCYLRPGVHLNPILKQMEISYSYEGKRLLPQELLRIEGKNKQDILLQIKQKQYVSVFKQFPYENNALYFGFSDKWESGPVSLFFELREDNSFPGSVFRFEYSSLNGFKPLKVIDHTEGLCHTGTLMFQPPKDMKAIEIEGKKRYWIRMTEEDGVFDSRKHSYPILKDFHINGVEVHNVETKDMQEYFIDTPAANMKFPLYSENILDAEVWVNEKELYTSAQINQILTQDSENAKAEYNFLGEVQEFYRRWEETDQFHNCERGARVYRLDRMQNKIIFGDGIKVGIPRNTTGAAFKVRVRCSVGSHGNIGVNNINSFLGNVMFVEQVYNTVPAYGGSDLEQLLHALKRSSNVISTRKRFISEQDFLCETMAFSDTIAQAKCFVEKGDIYMILLMNDFKKGGYSFRSLEISLRKHLLSHCEAILSQNKLRIIEPVYAAVSLNVWLVTEYMADAFLVQNEWKESIQEYFEPVQGKRRSGWKIGTMPTESQIRMMLKSMEKKAYVEKFSITVIYRDKEGFHETGLKEMAGNKKVICCNGTHTIYMRKRDG